MNRFVRVGLWILAHLFSIIFLAWAWLRSPDDFPTFPVDWSAQLALWYGARNAEDILDLEILLALAIGALIVCTLSFLIWLVRRLLKRRSSLRAR